MLYCRNFGVACHLLTFRYARVKLAKARMHWCIALCVSCHADIGSSIWIVSDNKLQQRADAAAGPAGPAPSCVRLSLLVYSSVFVLLGVGGRDWPRLQRSQITVFGLVVPWADLLLYCAKNPLDTCNNDVDE